MPADVRPLAAGDADAAASLVKRALGDRRQVRLGQLVDVLALPGLGAVTGDQLVGIATGTWSEGSDRGELACLAVDASHRDRGIGGTLLEAAVQAAGRAGCSVLWLVTTNDNLDALRLYQRHDFRITALHHGAVDRARAVVKPGLPLTGAYGIPLRDELVLERRLR